jgi:hypothetical protein
LPFGHTCFTYLRVICPLNPVYLPISVSLFHGDRNLQEVNILKKIKDNWILNRRGEVYLDEDINKLKMFTKESLDHWIVKALTFYILRKMKHDVVTEFEITGLGQGDLLDLTTNTQYEIETVNNRNYHKRRVEQYRRVGVDVVVIPTNKLPIDIKVKIKAIKQYIRPD